MGEDGCRGCWHGVVELGYLFYFFNMLLHLGSHFQMEIFFLQLNVLQY